MPDRFPEPDLDPAWGEDGDECPTCDGLGVVDTGEAEETCPDCEGTGDADAFDA